jgi:outer membrane receptor protein involved in Fe transport
VLDVALAQAPATAQDSANTTEDIVVTATKRDEVLVKVPIAVSVVTESAIAARGIPTARSSSSPAIRRTMAMSPLAHSRPRSTWVPA